MKKRLWLLMALVIGVTMWAAPCLAAEVSESYLPLCYGRGDVNVAADAENFYWIEREFGAADDLSESQDVVWQVPRQGGDKTRLYAAKSIKYLSCANGSLFFIADGRLIEYYIADGKSKQLAEWADKPTVYQGYVYYLKYISEWHQQLCCKTAGGGTEYMLADYTNRYWFNEGRVCWLQEFSTPEHGSGFVGSLPLGGNGGAVTESYYTYAFDWADGWYYCKDVVKTEGKYGQGKLYRWRWNNGQREFEKVLLLPENSRFYNVQVVYGTLYCTMLIYSEYRPGQMAYETSPLYVYDIEADGLPRKLTDCKVSDFYVFGDQVVYKEAWWYGETRPQWQVLDLAK